MAKALSEKYKISIPYKKARIEKLRAKVDSLKR